MNILDSLHEFGSKIVNLFSEPSLGTNGTSLKDKSDIKDIFSRYSLNTFLPYQAYDQESGIFINQNSLGFVIETIPLVGADDAAQKEILSIFQEMMEEQSSIQCLLWADHRISPFLNMWEKAREQADQIYKDLSRKRAEFLSKAKSNSPRIFRFILSYSIEIDKLDYSRIQSLKETKARILKTLSSLTYAFPWDAQDFVQALDGIVNFRMEPELVKRRWSPYETLSGQLSTGGRLRVEEDRLDWKTSKEVSFKSYRVVDFPDSWSLGAMQRLIGDLFRDSFRIHTPFIIHYGVHCPNQDKAESSFWKSMQLIENQGKSYTLLRLIPELAEELKEYDYVRRSCKQESKFVWTQLGVGIWSDKASLPNVEQSIKSIFRINQFSLIENDCIHLPQFLAFLPMTWGEYVSDLKNMNLLKTTIAPECGNLVPIQGEWIGTNTPGMLLIGRRGQLLNWNPFDNKSGNYNCVVVGRSGSGKSVFMQDLLISSLGVGARVFILEVGRSFEKMCDSVKGQYIEFSKESNICLNPFTYISPDSLEEREQSFSMLKSIISSMAAPGEGTSDYDNALIERAIIAAWESKKTKATINDVAAWLKGQDDPKANALEVMLTPYISGGVHSRYFEGENNVDFTSPMVLIELEELKEKRDLQSVVLQLFIMTITNLTFLGDRKTPFHICIDEAWDLLRGKQTGVFIETLARRLRKYNGSLVIGTQSIDDFYTTPGALAAFENSDWMCLLSQKKSSIKRFAESGKVIMDEHKQLALESVTTRHGEYSEVMICDAEGNYSIARLILDPFSELLYTTKADQYTRVKELQNRGMSIGDAIEQVLREQTVQK